jgi:hypothetical protein
MLRQRSREQRGGVDWHAATIDDRGGGVIAYGYWHRRDPDDWCRQNPKLQELRFRRIIGLPAEDSEPLVLGGGEPLSAEAALAWANRLAKEVLP